MFTGIVEGTGRIASVDREGDGTRMVIEVPDRIRNVEHGASISVNGVCLTVESWNDDLTSVDVFLATETIDRTNLGSLDTGDIVNIERAMRAESRFDGHIVQGHVDCTTEILAIEEMDNDRWFRFQLPPGLERYFVEKGSVTIDGISLTIATIDETSISVTIIPTTIDRTNLSDKNVGDLVNIEVDIIAKYIERMVDRNH